MKKNLVSVVIPTYNRAWCIKRAIDSVLRQTYVDWELIIVDDGSTDNTKEIIDAYPQDKRINYYKKSNGGVHSARNLGIIKSTGDYITYLDSDDEFVEDYLENAVNLFVSMSNCNLLKDVAVIHFNTLHNSSKTKNGMLPFKFALLNFEDYLSSDIYGFESCMVEKTKVIKDEKFFFDEDIFRESVRHARIMKKYPILYFNNISRIWHTEGQDRILFKIDNKKFNMQYKGILRYIEENGKILKNINIRLFNTEIKKMVFYGALSGVPLSKLIKDLSLLKGQILFKIFVLIYYVLFRKIGFIIFLKTFKLFSRRY